MQTKDVAYVLVGGAVVYTLYKLFNNKVVDNVASIGKSSGGIIGDITDVASGVLGYVDKNNLFQKLKDLPAVAKQDFQEAKDFVNRNTNQDSIFNPIKYGQDLTNVAQGKSSSNVAKKLSTPSNQVIGSGGGLMSSTQPQSVFNALRNSSNSTTEKKIVTSTPAKTSNRPQTYYKDARGNTIRIGG